MREPTAATPWDMAAAAPVERRESRRPKVGLRI